MSTGSRSGSPWFVATAVILAAGALTLVLQPDEPPPSPLPTPLAGASTSPDSAAPPAFAWEGGPELDRLYELAPGEAFELQLDSGAIEVVSSEDSQARVRVDFVDGARPPARFEWEGRRDESGTRVRIRAQDARSWLSRLFSSDDEGEILVEGERVKVSSKRARVGLVLVSLPPDSPLVIFNGAGEITISDRRAPVTVSTGAGNVMLRGVAANVSVESGAGDLRLEQIVGDAHVESGAGDIVANGVLGKLKVSSGAGRVSFTGAPSSVEVETGAGAVEGELHSLSGPVDIQTGMGGVVLRLPRHVSATLRAESGLGSVGALIDGQQLSARRGQPLTATLGEGGPAIRLHTGTGSIRISDASTVGAN